VELVERRKQKIQSNVTGGDPTELTAMMAAQQVITRNHLAACDASARSWLHTADAAKRVQQTQFMLIINNLSIPVNDIADPYNSVIKAWVSALETMERLTQGIPQRVLDGSILLAVSSWHLYPDMDVLTDNGVKHVDQKDELMHRSLITVAKSRQDPTREGVFWSLPLSRMRFYHPPDMVDRRLASDTSRVTMDEFLVVILGAMVGRLEEDINIMELCIMIRETHTLFKSKLGTKPLPDCLQVAYISALAYLDASPVDSLQREKLFHLGCRRGWKLLSTGGFLLKNLFDFDSMFSMIEDDHWLPPGVGPQGRITILRNIAQNLDCAAEDIIIRYRTECRGPFLEDTFVFASAIPMPVGSSKRMHDSSTKCPVSHIRWVIANTNVPKEYCSRLNCDCGTYPFPSCQCIRNGNKCTEYCHPHNSPCGNFSSAISFECTRDIHKSVVPEQPTDLSAQTTNSLGDGESWPEENDPEHISGRLGRGDTGAQLGHCLTWPYCNGCYNKTAKQHVNSEGELCELIFFADYKSSNAFAFKLSTLNSPGSREFTFMCGDLETVALFRRTNTHPEQKPLPKRKRPQNLDAAGLSLGFATSVLWDRNQVLLHPGFSIQNLELHWNSYFATSPGARLSIRSALKYATELYQEFSGGTVNLQILDVDLSKTYWAKNSSVPHDANHSVWSSRAFACPGMLESGYYDIRPDHLKRAFAMSSGDSIYVLSSLLEDLRSTEDARLR
jgi:hypothetical protein